MVQGEKCNNDDADKMNSRKWQATKTKIFELNTIKESKKKNRKQQQWQDFHIIVRYFRLLICQLTAVWLCV